MVLINDAPAREPDGTVIVETVAVYSPSFWRKYDREEQCERTEPQWGSS